MSICGTALFQIRDYLTGEEESWDLTAFRVNDETALAKRQEMKHHQYIAEAIGKEDLLRRPMRYMKLKEVVMWDR